VHSLSAEESLQAHDQQRAGETQVPTKHMQTLEPWQDEECATHCYKQPQCIRYKARTY